MTHSEENQGELLRAILDSRTRSIALSSDEVLSFVNKKIYLGRPNDKPMRLRVVAQSDGKLTVELDKRGRPITKSPYEIAYLRRKDLYRKLVKLPKARLLAKAVRFASSEQTRKDILKLAVELNLSEIPRRKRLGEIKFKLAQEGKQLRMPNYNERTIRRTLKKLGFM